jgi:hypothetical protein
VIAMNLSRIAAIALMAMPLAAHAQVRISGLPFAPGALNGSEIVPIVQAGVTKQATAAQVAAIVTSMNNTWSGQQVFNLPYINLNANQYGASVNIGGCVPGDYEGYQAPNTIVGAVVGCVATPAGTFNGTVSWPDSGLAGFAVTLNPNKAAVGVTGIAGAGAANTYVYGANFSGVNCRNYSAAGTSGAGFNVINENGVEVDLGVYSTASGAPSGRFAAIGVQVNTDLGVAAGSVLDGIDLIGNQSLNHGYNIGYASENGAAQIGLFMAANSYATTSASMSAKFQSLVGGVARTSSLQNDIAGIFDITGYQGMVLAAPTISLNGPSTVIANQAGTYPATCGGTGFTMSDNFITGSAEGDFINCATGGHGFAMYQMSGAGAGTQFLRVDNGLVSGTNGPLLFAKFDCQNILTNGGDNTDTVDNTAALTAALAANTSAAQQCVYFPAGTYKFTSSQALSISGSYATGSISILGAGSDVTMLDFTSGTSGLSLTLASATQSVHIRDMSVLSGVYGSGTIGIAITQSATVANPAISALNDITNVSVRGDDGYALTKGFGTDIALNKVSNVDISNGYLGGPSSATNTCLSTVGTSGTIEVVINVSGETFNTCNYGLYYGAYVQGVTVSQSNFTGTKTGIFSPSSALGMSQLAVSDSQFAIINAGINLMTDPGAVTITNNFFLDSAGSTSGAPSINIVAALNDTITGNAFQGTATTNGVVVQSYTTPWSMLIGNNAFNQMATAIWLQASSQNVTVGINSFGGNTTNVLNSGTGNIVPVTCSGTPTSSFAAVNGVITHC